MRKPAIWLTTLATVVGIATGMFTLRDQIFPEESPTAKASPDVYRQSVGDVCRRMNDDDKARAASDRRLAAQLRRARTTAAQRDALLDSARRSIARSSPTLSSFLALKPASGDLELHRATAAIWNRSVERIRDYAHRLDTASDERELRAAVDVLAEIRPSNQRDAVKLDANLERLGAGRCQLDAPIVTSTISLPGHATPSPSVNEPAPAPTVNEPAPAQPGGGAGGP
jgi:hypothetical protein